MIFHVAGLDKFIPPFIEFVGKNFDLARHRFWLNGDRNRYPYQENPSTYQVKPGVAGKVSGYLRLALQLSKAEKVILLLSCMPWMPKKCYWVIWGGDLYVHKLGNKDWKWCTKEICRCFVIKRVGHLATYVYGDVQLARDWYGATGHHHECLMYTSNLYSAQRIIETQSNTINVHVGSSADPRNNHLEVLQRLIPYEYENIKIYVPLSYGSQEYANSVIQKGSAWFGENLVPLTEFMPLEKYLELLGQIDIAIFNHRRQQAMDNTITLLGLGKKVFIRSKTSPWDFFKKNGITLYGTKKLEISTIDPSIRKINQGNIRLNFPPKLKYLLKKIFENKNGILH